MVKWIKQSKVINMKKIKLKKEQVDRLTSRLNEERGVSGGTNRVDKTFDKEFKKLDLKLSEDTQSSIEILKHFVDLIYNNPSQSGLSTFFKQNGITWGDIATYLTSVGILGVTAGGVHRIANLFKKAYKSREEKLADLPKIADKAIESIKSNSNELIAIHNKRQGGKPTDLSSKIAMQQKPDSGWKKEPEGFKPNRFTPPVKSNPIEMPYMDTNESNYPADTENNPNSPWNQGDCQTDFPSKTDKFKGQYMNREIALLNSDEGPYMFDYTDIPREELPNQNCELDVEDIAIYASRNYKNQSNIRFGNSLNDYLKGRADLITLTEEVKQWLRRTYNKDKKLINILDKLMETTTAASSGSFTGLFGGNPNNSIVNPKQIPSKKLEIVNDEEQPSGESVDDVIEEMTSAGSSTGDPSSTTTGQYVQPRIWAKDKKNWVGNKKTQYPNGEMVKFDTCTKLNNNKKAQNGGCSQGAANNVVKTYKTKDSVISKNESIYEQVAAKTGRRVEEVKKLIENKLNKDLG